MDKKASVQSSVLLYIILLIVIAVIILILLEFLTPYKISNLFDFFINSSTSGNAGNLA